VYGRAAVDSQTDRGRADASHRRPRQPAASAAAAARQTPDGKERICEIDFTTELFVFKPDIGY
jgi:hypothetical protein